MGLQDFMQSGAGQVIGPALAGLAGAAGGPGANQGVGNILGGLQAMMQQKKDHELNQTLMAEFAPPPGAADSESANRTGVSQDTVAQSHRMIRALLAGDDRPAAMKQILGLQEMMQPKYGTISKESSVYNEGTGEIGAQAPGVYTVKGNTQMHTTKGFGDTTGYGDDLIAAKAVEASRKATADANDFSIDQAGIDIRQQGVDIKQDQLGINQQKADAYGESQAASANLSNVKAATEEINQGRDYDPAMVVKYLTEWVGSMEAQVMKKNNPKEYAQHVALLRHYGIALGEATAQNPGGTDDPDSTKEGVPDPQFEVAPLQGVTQGTDRLGMPSLPGGSGTEEVYDYDPNSRQTIKR